MKDQQFELLANEHRRLLLLGLLRANPQEEALTLGGIDSQHIDDESMPAEMFHTHLPKLEQAGYIEWDRETHTVVKGPQFEEIQPLLTLLDRHGDDLLSSGT